MEEICVEIGANLYNLAFPNREKNRKIEHMVQDFYLKKEIQNAKVGKVAKKER